MTRLPRTEFRARGYQSLHTSYFSLKKKQNGRSDVRIGVVVPKGVHKTAVRRNFWKRQARTAVPQRIWRGYDLIIALRPAVNDLTRRQFRDMIAKITP
ncbi:MAG TPA: ribonuclease P protein component [Candidatus Paceibacterota bacterium]|nr:ribonuclease P protein component [Candidatus Paceibacterota bacterium]